MANVQRPGYMPIRTAGTQFTRTRHIVSDNNTTRIRKGDAVIFATAGHVVATTTTTRCSGASMGATYMNADNEYVDSPVLPAAERFTGTTVAPYDASYIYLPDNVLTDYVASVDEAIALTDLNLNYVMVLATTTATYSDHELDATSRATTNTLPWRGLSFLFGPDSDPDLADASIRIRLNAGLLEPALDTTGT